MIKLALPAGDLLVRCTADDQQTQVNDHFNRTRGKFVCLLEHVEQLEVTKEGVLQCVNLVLVDVKNGDDPTSCKIGSPEAFDHSDLSKKFDQIVLYGDHCDLGRFESISFVKFRRFGSERYTFMYCGIADSDGQPTEPQWVNIFEEW
jgi:hypothetical protein